MDTFVVLLLLAIVLKEIKGTKNDAIFQLHECARRDNSIFAAFRIPFLLLFLFRLFRLSPEDSACQLPNIAHPTSISR